jgi:hypothetical protein
MFPTSFEAAGQWWRFSIDCWSIRHVRQVTGFSLGKMGSLSDLFREGPTLGAVLWTLVEDQAGPVSPEEFVVAVMKNPDPAFDALCAAISEFLPEPSGESKPEVEGASNDLETVCLEIAGMLGIDPFPSRLTLRELTTMARARGQSEWYRSAAMAAATAFKMDPYKSIPAALRVQVPEIDPESPEAREGTRRVLDGIERLAKRGAAHANR